MASWLRILWQRVAPVAVAARRDLEESLEDALQRLRNVVELEGQVAEVLVEDASALHEVAQLVHLDRHDLQGALELLQVLLLTQVPGEPAQLLDVVADQRAAVDQQARRLLGELGDRVERAEDGLTVLLEASHELPQRRDGVPELGVAGAEHV